MNTVEKGDKFEDRVYKALKLLLENEELPLNSKRTKVFQKKKYYSPIQKNDVIFDISIESYMPNSDKYSLLWLIECKDYKSSIEVGKIRNFKKQIEEVGGHKGVFITTSKFQKGAISSAISYGMGLAVMNDNDSISWQVQRLSSSGKSYYHISNLNEIFTGEEYLRNDSFVGSCDDLIFSNLIDFLSYNGFNIASFPVITNYLDEKIIEEIAVKSINKNHLDINYKVSTNYLIDIIRDKYKIEVLSYLPLNHYELGKLDFVNNRIYISNLIEKESPRWRFTLAHELGHAILHKKILMNGNIHIATDNDNYSDPYLSLASVTAEKNIKRIEIQANIFASYLLMPNIPMAIELIKLQKELGLNKSYIHYDDQPVNIRICNLIFLRISEYFSVSKEVVKYRLLKMQLIKDFSHTKSLSSVFRNMLSK